MDKALVGIQVSRGIAAIMVVMAHGYLFFGASTLTTAFSPGIVGVDFFFVLSGFIIFYIHHRDIGHVDRVTSFARKRLIRVLPIYWLYTLLFLALDKFVVGALTGKTLIPYYHGAEDLVRSLMLLPPDRNAGESPILPPAWTLSHELLFYCLFGLALSLGKRVSLVLSTAWVVLILMSAFGLFRAAPVWVSDFLLSPLNVEFLLGCLIAFLVCAKAEALQRWRVIIVATGLVLLGACWALSMRGALESATLRVMTFGPTFALLILGAVLMELHAQGSRRWMQSRWVRLMKELGDGSYSIYLVHFIPLYLISIILSKQALTGGTWAGLPAVLACVATVVLGWLGYRLLERPLLNALREWRVRKSPHVGLQ